MDYLWVLARSGTQESRGRGLSLFICDKNSPGVMVSPLPTLDLAADTGSSQREPRRSLRLLDGEVMVRIHPGIEAGHMEILLRHSGEPHDA